MEQIFNFIQVYGLPVFIIATWIIIFLGGLKLLKVFDKIKSKNVKKFIYYAIDISLAFGGIAIYFAIFKLDFANYLPLCATQVSATTTLYAVYENLGARKLVQMFWSWFAKFVEENKHNKLIKYAQKIGLDNALNDIKNFTIEQAQKLEEQNKKEQFKAEVEKKEEPITVAVEV